MTSRSRFSAASVAPSASKRPRGMLELPGKLEVIVDKEKQDA